MKIIRLPWVLFLSIFSVLVWYPVFADEFYIHDAKDLQKDFVRSDQSAFSQARYSAHVEGKTITVRSQARLGAGTTAVRATVGGAEEIWLVGHDEQGRLTNWQYRKYAPVAMGGTELAALADTGTTVVGLASGFAEGNPLGFGVAAAIKAGLIVGSRTADFSTCVQLRSASDTVWTGVSVANIMTILGAPIGLSIAGMIATGIARNKAASELAEWECAVFALDNI